METEDKKNIMEQIMSGDVRMRPKSYFIAGSLLKIIAGVGLAALAMFLVSFFVFLLYSSRAIFLPEFGARGVRDLLLSLPWIILALTVIFMILLLKFAKLYPIAYRNPLLYSLLAIVVLVLLGGYLVFRTPLHPFISRNFAKNRNHGIMRGLFNSRRMMSLHNGIFGSVKSVAPGELLLTGEDENQVWKVFMSDQTRILPRPPVEVGQWVLVHGNREGEIINAWEVRKVPAPEE